VLTVLDSSDDDTIGIKPPFEALSPRLNERARRLFVASEARAADRVASLLFPKRQVWPAAHQPRAGGTPLQRASALVLHPSPLRWLQTEDRDRAWTV
jgi:hypothetical protein